MKKLLYFGFILFAQHCFAGQDKPKQALVLRVARHERNSVHSIHIEDFPAGQMLPTPRTPNGTSFAQKKAQRANPGMSLSQEVQEYGSMPALEETATVLLKAAGTSVDSFDTVGSLSQSQASSRESLRARKQFWLLRLFAKNK